MPAKPVVLYEGEEDRSFLRALNPAGLVQKCDLHPNPGGKDKFETQLRGLIAEGGLNGEIRPYVIIIGDNDGSPTASFNAIKTQIERAGYNAPSVAKEVMATSGRSSVSVFMMPQANADGCLETLLFQSINFPKYRKEWECSERLMECIEAGGWETAKKAKLRMRCFLSSACKSDPNTGLRYAFSTNGGRPGDLFDLTHGCFNEIRDYFSSLLTPLAESTPAPNPPEPPSN